MFNFYERFRDFNLVVTSVENEIILHKLKVICDLRSKIACAQVLDMDFEIIMGQPE